MSRIELTALGPNPEIDNGRITVHNCQAAEPFGRAELQASREDAALGGAESDANEKRGPGVSSNATFYQLSEAAYGLMAASV